MINESSIKLRMKNYPPITTAKTTNYNNYKAITTISVFASVLYNHEMLKLRKIQWLKLKKKTDYKSQQNQL